MRLVTWNVNGVRAALTKGLDARLAAIDADVVMLQEIRCTEDKLPKGWAMPDRFRAHWHPAQKPGWSGVATWSRVGLDVESVGLAGEDPEGRILITRVGGARIVNTYLPSGSAGPERQVMKEAFMAQYLPFLGRYLDDAVPTLIVGDLNIAPGPHDVHDPTSAKKLSGYLPQERAWFDGVLGGGWTDVVRRDHGDRKGPYTWWSNFGRAKVEDRGWRLDHVLANRAAAGLVRLVGVDREAGIQCSDHAPVIVELGP